MKILIVEDEFTSRKVLQKMLSEFGDCDVTIDGEEAIEAFQMAWEDMAPYRLICLDIMMPNVDGQQALQKIREIEKSMGIEGNDEVKVLMITALDDPKTVMSTFKNGATGYLVKPIEREKLVKELKNFGFVE